MSSLESADACCAYCGLPLAAPWRLWNAATPPTREPEYCCTGCQFAAEVVAERDTPAGLHTVLGRVGLAAFLTLNVLVFTMALWTDEVYGAAADADAALDRPLAAVFRYLSLLLSLPVAWLLGGPLLQSAWRQLRRGQLSTDLLLAIGVVASFAYSAVSVFRGAGHVYFEVGCIVLLAVTIGRWLESSGKIQATAALDRLDKLLPTTVRRMRDGCEQIIPLAQVFAGDCLRVLAGERIATDGVIVAGSAAIDQSLLTGESESVTCQPGDRVLGGALNLDGQLSIQVTAAVAEGTLQRLIQHVRQARFAKGYYQQVADRVAAVFLPVICCVALLATAWHAYYSGLDAGLMVGLAVVLIACPCAKPLATPLATWSALSTAAAQQVLFQRGELLERLATVKVICFDKTGTLTTGAARVVEFAVAHHEAAEVLAGAALLSAGSNHPQSRAIVQLCELQAPQTCSFTLPNQPSDWHVRTLPGRGLVGTLGAVDSIWLGSLRLMKEQGLEIPTGLQAAVRTLVDSGRSICAIGWQGQLRGVFSFEEKMRPEASEALAELAALGLHIEILTGDHAARAQQLSQSLGVDARSGLLPEDKESLVAELRRQYGPVAMVGDGVNDAPRWLPPTWELPWAVADVSRDSADVCLLGNDLRRIVTSIRLARQTLRVVRQNLFWALIYNVLGVGLAAAGWLNPLWAAGAMVISSLLVIGNSARLRSATTTDAEQAALAESPGRPNSALPAPDSLAVQRTIPSMSDTQRARTQSYA